MSDESQVVTDTEIITGTENLPESERQEVAEIHGEIKAEETPSTQTPPAETPTPEAPKDPETLAPEAPKPADAEKPGETTEPKEPVEPKQPEAPRSKGKLMPAWAHEVATKKLNQEIENLKGQLAAKGDTTGQQPASPPTQAPQSDEKLNEQVNSLAEKHNLDPELVKSIVELGRANSNVLPPEVQALIAKSQDIDTIKASYEVQAEEQAFNSSFDEHVVPLIKAEYGEDVGKDTIDAIRESMKETAYTEEFQGTPYSVIYKGVDTFRGYSRPAAQTAEPGRGGTEHVNQHTASEVDFSTVSQEDIDKMDGETFDKYSDWLGKQPSSK